MMTIFVTMDNNSSHDTTYVEILKYEGNLIDSQTSSIARKNPNIDLQSGNGRSGRLRIA